MHTLPQDQDMHPYHLVQNNLGPLVDDLHPKHCHYTHPSFIDGGPSRLPESAVARDGGRGPAHRTPTHSTRGLRLPSLSYSPKIWGIVRCRLLGGPGLERLSLTLLKALLVDNL